MTSAASLPYAQVLRCPAIILLLNHRHPNSVRSSLHIILAAWAAGRELEIGIPILGTASTRVHVLARFIPGLFLVNYLLPSRDPIKCAGRDRES